MEIEKNRNSHFSNISFWNLTGNLITPLRLVVGWIFLSAFWRRVVLEIAKMNPDSPAFLGHKFNTFLPQALWIKPVLDYLLTHADLLFVFLIIFTIIEGLVGLFLILGFASRISGMMVSILSFGILLGSGWLGSTCLDEWQIGNFGIASGMIIFFFGGGSWSFDNLFYRKKYSSQRKISAWFTSGPLPLNYDPEKLSRLATIFSIIAIGITLYTNQAFHGGVWGKLHNDSKKPHIVISDIKWDNFNNLEFTLFRDKGPDTYGAFIIEMNIKNANGEKIMRFGSDELKLINQSQIENVYPNKIKPGAYGIEVPLGGKGKINLDTKDMIFQNGKYTLEVFDVSGAKWSSEFQVG